MDSIPDVSLDVDKPVLRFVSSQGAKLVIRISAVSKRVLMVSQSIGYVLNISTGVPQHIQIMCPRQGSVHRVNEMFASLATLTLEHPRLPPKTVLGILTREDAPIDVTKKDEASFERMLASLIRGPPGRQGPSSRLP